MWYQQQREAVKIKPASDFTCGFVLGCKRKRRVNDNPKIHTLSFKRDEHGLVETRSLLELQISWKIGS